MVKVVASDVVAEWLNRLRETTGAGQTVVLQSDDGPAAVMMDMDTFEALVGLSDSDHPELLPFPAFQQGFGRALADAGYTSRDDIVALVREVKREVANESERG